jgi:tRNA dimethylallyltransferase
MSLNLNLPKNQVIIIAGATSVGKSAVAQEVCNTIKNAEIVIADSVQVYRYLDIGSNKPTKEEMLEVPHHMVDLCDPSEVLSTGDFSRRAADIIHEILARNKVPVVVGGSTMWIEVHYICYIYYTHYVQLHTMLNIHTIHTSG